MARKYAEEVERRGNKVQLAFEKEEAKQEDDAKVQTTTAEGVDKSQKPEQEVIVLRGGFTQWSVISLYKLYEISPI